jgi:hypothetical protein
MVTPGDEVPRVAARASIIHRGALARHGASKRIVAVLTAMGDGPPAPASV